MAAKENHKYERPAKVRAVKAKHPKGFGTDKEHNIKKTWWETKCVGVLFKGTRDDMRHVTKNCGREKV